jgi:hypothetical protein
MDRWDDFRRPLDMGDWHNIERRIGVRVPTSGQVVRWILPDEVDLRDDGFLGRITEVSVTGAAISSGPLPVEVPCRARLRYGTTESAVTIRHAHPGDAAGVTVYGVEWDALEEPLREVVFGIVADARSVGATR